VRDVIKKGTSLFVEGRGPVEPFQGKYAVKTSNVFNLARAGWAAAGLDPDAPYLPMRIELELTTKCNDSCPSCGMGALPLTEGRTLTDLQIGFLLDQFESIGLPSLAITGGEPFTAWRALLRMVASARGRIDISKLTTNGAWGTDRRCGPVFGRLEKAGFLNSRLFVPLLMVSIGEQTTPLENIARILRHAVTHYTDRELNVAVSSLADPATREHRVDDLIDVYEAAYGAFPHDRVHSTVRVYLENQRLDGQAPSTGLGTPRSSGGWTTASTASRPPSARTSCRPRCSSRTATGTPAQRSTCRRSWRSGTCCKSRPGGSSSG
jgi:hypothetical protein